MLIVIFFIILITGIYGILLYRCTESINLPVESTIPLDIKIFFYLSIIIMILLLGIIYFGRYGKSISNLGRPNKDILYITYYSFVLILLTNSIISLYTFNKSEFNGAQFSATVYPHILVSYMVAISYFIYNKYNKVIY